MAKSNKSKWMIGLTGAALSAFVITQVGGANGQSQAPAAQEQITTQTMSKQEKELVQLDWSNYSVNGVAVANPKTISNSAGGATSDRQTRRS